MYIYIYVKHRLLRYGVNRYPKSNSLFEVLLREASQGGAVELADSRVGLLQVTLDVGQGVLKPDVAIHCRLHWGGTTYKGRKEYRKGHL